MEFRVLGPLEIRDDNGHELPLGRGRERALLALLVLHANEVVSLDRIVDSLWGEDAPPTAGKIVRNQISQLRRLVDGQLATAGHGYRLDVPPGSVDVERFEALVAHGRRELHEGRPAAAADLLAAALSLWRGPPLEEFAYEQFALGDIARLEELRAAAIEDRIDAQLALGQHAEAIPELEQMVDRYPLRERLRQQLMLALYRSGRQAEALDQYRQARLVLIRELGLEPTEELRQLERAILAHDPALAAPPPGPVATADGAKALSPPASLRRLFRPRLLVVIGLVLVVGAVVAAADRILGGSSEPSAPKQDAVAIVDPRSGRVVDRVAVGGRPVAVAVGAGSVWIANADDGTLSKINPHERKVVATIGLGVPTSDVAVGKGSVWVTGGSEGTLLRIDPRTDTVVKKIDLAGSNPLAPDAAYSVAVGADAVWVGSASWRVLRIDPETETVTGSIPVGHIPVALAVAGGDVWATLLDGRTVRIDARTDESTGTVSGPSTPMDIGVGSGSVWVADEPGALWQIDAPTVTVTRTVTVPASMLSLAVSGRDVWATSSQTAAVTRVDARSGTVLGTVPVGGPPLDVAAGAGEVWVTLGRSASLQP